MSVRPRLFQRSSAKTVHSAEKKTEDDVYSIELERLQNRLSSGLGTKVKISHNKNRGKIEIEYYGNDDLERILSMFSVEY